MSTQKENFIDENRSDFDPDENLLLTPAGHGGYHSDLPQGFPVHPLRQSARYGLALLESSRPSDRNTGAEILIRITSLQETDTASPWYGGWPYFLEEPLDKMNPPDMNWLSFIGQYLLIAAADYREMFSNQQYRALESSLEHTAYGIFRRNMQPAYTNIAVFEASVLSCITSLILNDFLKDYAFNRFRLFARYTEQQGGFNEYNSPVYAAVLLRSLELVHQFGKDRRITPFLEYLHRREWELISDYYHPFLGELSGPHSRAYSDVLDNDTRDFYSVRTASNLAGYYRHPRESRGGWEPEFVVPWHCPEDLKPKFREPVSVKALEHIFFRETGKKWIDVPEDPFGYQRRHTEAAEGEWNISGYTAVKPRLSLGTVNRDSLWTQRRPYLGYAVSGDNLALIRIRLLKDNQDWATGCLHNRQKDLNVLSAITFLRDFGDYHLFLDRHRNTGIRLSSLKIRFQIENAAGIFREAGTGGHYSLDLGDYTFHILIPRELRFNGRNCSIEISSDSGDRSFEYLDIQLPVTDSFPDLQQLGGTDLFWGTCITGSSEEAVISFPEMRKSGTYTWQSPGGKLGIRTFGTIEDY